MGKHEWGMLNAKPGVANRRHKRQQQQATTRHTLVYTHTRTRAQTHRPTHTHTRTEPGRREGYARRRRPLAHTRRSRARRSIGPTGAPPSPVLHFQPLCQTAAAPWLCQPTTARSATGGIPGTYKYIRCSPLRNLESNMAVLIISLKRFGSRAILKYPQKFEISIPKYYMYTQSP